MSQVAPLLTFGFSNAGAWRRWGNALASFVSHCQGPKCRERRRETGLVVDNGQIMIIKRPLIAAASSLPLCACMYYLMPQPGSGCCGMPR